MIEKRIITKIHSIKDIAAYGLELRVDDSPILDELLLKVYGEMLLEIYGEAVDCLALMNREDLI